MATRLAAGGNQRDAALGGCVDIDVRADPPGLGQQLESLRGSEHVRLQLRSLAIGEHDRGVLQPPHHVLFVRRRRRMDRDLAPLAQPLERRLPPPEIGPIVKDHKSLLHGSATVSGTDYRPAGAYLADRIAATAPFRGSKNKRFKCPWTAP